MNIRHLAGASLTLILISFHTADGKIIHWPNHCKNGTLQLTNSSEENRYVWLQSFTDHLESETEIEVEMHSTLNISVEKLFANERNSILQFADRNLLNSKFICNQSIFKSEEHDGGTHKFVRTKENHHKLMVQNLSQLENSIEVNVFDAKNNVILKRLIQLQASESDSLSLDELKNWHTVVASSDKKYTSFMLTSSNTVDPTQQPTTGKFDASAAYFLVGVRENEDDSFVVKITDETLKKQARELAMKPEIEKIVFAKIDKGHQFYNRNYNNKSRSFWSWSVTEVTGFGDFGSTSCNGHPQAVEDRLDSWVKYPGRICFWDYRIKKELNREEIESGRLKP